MLLARAPEGPRRTSGNFPRVALEPLGPWHNNLKTHVFCCAARLSGRDWVGLENELLAFPIRDLESWTCTQSLWGCHPPRPPELM